MNREVIQIEVMTGGFVLSHRNVDTKEVVQEVVVSPSKLIKRLKEVLNDVSLVPDSRD